jgi:hypothetical protein
MTEHVVWTHWDSLAMRLRLREGRRYVTYRTSRSQHFPMYRMITEERRLQYGTRYSPDQR